MEKIISKTIEIETPELPPKTDFIENEIRNLGFEPIRWAITEVQNNKLTLSVSGYKIN